MGVCFLALGLVCAIATSQASGADPSQQPCGTDCSGGTCCSPSTPSTGAVAGQAAPHMVNGTPHRPGQTAVPVATPDSPAPEATTANACGNSACSESACSCIGATL